MTSNKKRIRLSEIIGPAFYETHKLIDMGVIDEAVESGGRASLKSSYVGTELVLQLLKHPDCHALVYLVQRIYSSLSSVLKCRASALSAMPERCSPVRRCSAIPKRMPRAGLRL